MPLPNLFYLYDKAIQVYGVNKHVWELSIAQVVFAAKVVHVSKTYATRPDSLPQWLFLAEFSYICVVGMTKMSILLFYRRLAGQNFRHAFRYAVYVMMAEIVAYKPAYLIAISLTCRPLDARWKINDPAWVETHHFTCMDESMNIIIGSTLSAVEDLIIALLPTLLIWKLQLPLRQKLALWCLFSLSISTSIAGFVRSYFIYLAFWSQKGDWTCRSYPSYHCSV